MLPYYCGIWVTCFTFSMAGSASTSFSTFYCTKAKVNGQTALCHSAVWPFLCYAARQVRVKQMRCSQWAVVVRRDAVKGFTVPCCTSGRSF